MHTRRAMIVALALLGGCTGTGENSPRIATIAVGQTDLDDPVLSPDGSMLAFTDRDRELDGVWIGDADGSDALLVSELSPDVGALAWSPDGSTLVFSFVDSTSRTVDLYAVRVGHDGQQRLTRSNLIEVRSPAFSPDGSTILFSARTGPAPSVWTVPAGGGDVTELPKAGYAGMFGGKWSPDGTRIAAGAFAGDSVFVVVLDVGSSEVRRVTTEGDEVLADWSPDGQELLYESLRAGQIDLWLIPAAGGVPRQLTRDVREDFEGRYSPDGRWIAYISKRGGQQDLWLVPSGGGEATRVTNDRAQEGRMSWAPDSRSLIYTQYDQVAHLYSVTTSGGALRQVSTGGENFLGPEISPDNQTIVYLAERGGLTGIYKMPIDGGAETPIITGSNSSDLVLSPDGSTIAFTSFRDSRPAVWAASLETGAEWQISPPGVVSFRPEFSPDGSRVAFESTAFGGESQLVTASVRGGELALVSELDDASNAEWSPDGMKIAFHKFVGAPDVRGMFVAPASGGSAIRLTAGQRVAGSPAAWSWDGTRIAYNVQSSTGGLHVYIMNADGSGKRRLTNDTRRESAPLWSPDDSEIYFGNPFWFGAANIATQDVRTIFELEGERQVRFFSLSSDRSVGVFQIFSTANVLARVDVRDVVDAR